MAGMMQKALAALWDRITDPAPTNRHVDFTYIEIYRKNTLVGMFVPELYELAMTPHMPLKCQHEFNEWAKNREFSSSKAKTESLAAERQDLFLQLYRKDGTAKTAFELAIVPTKSQKEVAARMVKEYKFRRDQKWPLPTFVSKFRVAQDHLRDIENAGLHVKGDKMGILSTLLSYVWLKRNTTALGVNSKINIPNPVEKMTNREIFLHYAGSWIAWLMTLSTAIAIVETAGLASYASPLGIGLMIATYLAKKCTNDFYLFDLAESLHRSIGSKDLSWKGKISWPKLLETGVYIAAVGIAIFFAAKTVWFDVLALPVTGLIELGLPVAMLNFMHYGVAAVITGVTALMTYTGASYAQRFFWGLSVYDNQIPFTQDMGTEVALPAVNVAKTPEGKLVKLKQEVLTKLTQSKLHMTANEEQSVILLFNNLGNNAQTRSLSAEQSQPTQPPIQEDRTRIAP